LTAKLSVYARVERRYLRTVPSYYLGSLGWPSRTGSIIDRHMDESQPSEDADRLLALQELHSLGIVDEREYADAIGSDANVTRQASPANPTAARIKVAFLRRFLRRNRTS
jgi:hypothetical protein